ncbi:MAG: TlpA disulfide reductase family protein [Chromatiales bacterium]
MNTFKFVALLAIASAAFGVALGFYQKQSEPQAADSETITTLDKLPAFSYPDLQGNQRSSSEWRNTVVVLNFWASWCPPCRKETPDFIELQNRHQGKVQFVGIAIDDQQPVAEFAKSFGINYPTLLGDMAAIEMSRQLGNRFSGLPFTAIFDREGKLQHAHTGGLSRETLEKQLQELM